MSDASDTSDQLIVKLGALGHAVRLRIIAELAERAVHVSELARRVGVSRPLLYMHLEKLENAGFLTGRLELGADGRALKYYELVAFDLRLTVDTVLAALAADHHDKQDDRDNEPDPKEERA